MNISPESNVQVLHTADVMLTLDKKNFTDKISSIQDFALRACSMESRIDMEIPTLSCRAQLFCQVILA